MSLAKARLLRLYKIESPVPPRFLSRSASGSLWKWRGGWRSWKTKGRFSLFPPTPWESRKNREIPPFPQPRRLVLSSPIKSRPEENRSPWKSGNLKAGFPLLAQSQTACSARKKPTNHHERRVRPLSRYPPDRLVLENAPRGFRSVGMRPESANTQRCAKFTHDQLLADGQVKPMIVAPAWHAWAVF